MTSGTLSRGSKFPLAAPMASGGKRDIGGATYRGTSLAVGTGAAGASSQTLQGSGAGLGGFRGRRGGSGAQHSQRCSCIPESGSSPGTGRGSRCLSVPGAAVWPWSGATSAVAVPASRAPCCHPSQCVPCPRAHLGTGEAGFSGASGFTGGSFGADGAGGAALAGGTLGGGDRGHPGCRTFCSRVAGGGGSTEPVPPPRGHG